MDIPSALRRDAATGIAFRTVGPAAPQALVLLLHGVGGNETNLEGLAGALDPRILSVLPRGPLTLGPGASGWFQVSFGPTGPVIDAAQAEAGRLQLAALVESLQRETGIGPDRTVLAGFSQGGIMSAGLGLTRPDLVAGFGLLSGRILPELAPRIAARAALAGLSGFVSHGLRDTTLPPAWADRSDAWLGELGVAFESRRYPAGHELTPDMARDFRTWLLGRLYLPLLPPR
jgi:phospholipase/carboxylesterase